MNPETIYIPIRPRGILTLCDLTLCLVGRHAGSLLLALAVPALGFLIVDYAILLGGLAYHEGKDMFQADAWNAGESLSGQPTSMLMLLTYLQAPWGTACVTTYVGHLMFCERPSIESVLAACYRAGRHLAWHHGICRGAIIGTALALAGSVTVGGAANTTLDTLLFVTVVIVLVTRTLRPFMTELILLEQLPEAREGGYTVAQRCSAIHQPVDVPWRSVVLLIVATLFAVSVLGVGLFFVTSVFGTSRMGACMFFLAAGPLLWIVAGVWAVARYLFYLDVRVRAEGWDIQLLALNAQRELDTSPRETFA